MIILFRVIDGEVLKSDKVMGSWEHGGK